MDSVPSDPATIASETASHWRCAQCGTSHAESADGRQFCDGCGRPRQDVDWACRARRAALIAFGVALQGMSGAMMWLVPPGSSVWAWIIYIGLGAVGFLHMFLGIELSRRDARESSGRADRAEDDADRRSAPEPAALPLHVQCCPACQHTLIETIDRGRRVCPGCRVRFSLRDLGVPIDDPAGELLAASPHEARLSGGALVAALLTAAIAAGIVLTTLLAIGGNGGSAPGP